MKVSLQTLIATVLILRIRFAHGGDVTGDNVCTFMENKTEIVLEKFVQTVPYRTTVWCTDFMRGFKCPVTRMGEKVSYKSVPKEVEVEVQRCCEGYRQSGDDKCYPVCLTSCNRGICIAPDKCECEAGYAGDSCSEVCETGSWGVSCSSRCDCVNGATCDPSNGACLCLAGFKGVRCEATCDSGTWGAGCLMSCLCHNGGTCSPINGTCHCVPGFSGKLCELPCDQGKFGIDCAFNCECPQGRSCNATDGSCICAPGFTGKACDQPCPEGWFGTGCVEKCSPCLDGKHCDPVNGTCEIPLCPVGRYGSECSLDCDCNSNNTLSCNSVNGSCICLAGYTDARCDSICPKGIWGDNCANLCDCANKTLCHPSNGTCLCAAGLQGSRCDKNCTEGLFGEQCLSRCACDNDASCDPIDGRCICKEGWYGDRCQSKCDPNDTSCVLTGTSDHQRSELTSKLPQATAAFCGLLMLSVLLVALVFYYRRKYMIERDPTAPTISYYANEDYTTADLNGNQFNNPLYKRTPSSIPAKQIPEDYGSTPSYIEEDYLPGSTQNDYVSLDGSYANMTPDGVDAADDATKRGVASGAKKF